MGRAPYGALDRQRSRYTTLSALALTSLSVYGLLDAASECSASCASSESGWSDWSGWSGDSEWSSTSDGWVLQSQGALLLAADEPFRRAGVTYSIGPERYSFERLQRQFKARAQLLTSHRLSHLYNLSCPWSGSAPGRV